MRFRRNARLQAQLRQRPAYRQALKANAEKVERHADRLARATGAPWMPRGGETTIQTVQEGDDTRVVSTDHAGHLIEFGGRNNPPHAPLRRAVRAAGLRLDE